MEEGRTSLGGPLPSNPSVGLKVRGHPIGATGLAQIVEVVWRLRGEVVNMRKREVRRALTQSTGGLATNNSVAILERAENHILDAFLRKNSELAEETVIRYLENQMKALNTVLELGEEGRGKQGCNNIGCENLTTKPTGTSPSSNYRPFQRLPAEPPS